MSVYSRWIFPRLVDWTMSLDAMTALRRSLLAEVSGRALEIGFGTGLNLPHYLPEQIETLVAIDANPGMSKIAARRIEASPLQVDRRVLNGESLPFPEASFDCAVSTWTLCSIRQLDRALGEIYRVLEPGGAFAFIEHGLSFDPEVQTWQRRLTPIQKAIADGCHLDRDIASAISRHSFVFKSLDRFELAGLPKPLGYTYRGVAIKPAQPQSARN